MIQAAHNLSGRWFFNHYASFMIKRDFKQVVIENEFKNPKGPLIAIGNHSTWWDGFICLYLNNLYFKRNFYVMMLEEELEKRKFLRRAGAFSIKKGDRSSVESLEYAASILRNNQNLLLLYPQGKIISQYDSEIIFEQGWFRILKILDKAVHSVFFVALTDYFSDRKPTLYVYMTNYLISPVNAPEDVQLAFHSFYNECVEKQNKRV